MWRFAGVIKDVMKMSKLQERRKAAGYSQHQLSVVTGVSLRAIQQYEAGVRDINRARLESMIALCIALNCKISDILEGDELIAKYKIVK